MVNELSTDTKGRELVLDQWADVLPFPEASDYADEIPGLVFRYRNGEVTEAADYAWIRPHPGAEGCICRWTHGPDHGQPTVVYKTYSVFRRWRFSPVFWVGSDISVHGIDHYTADPQRMFISLRFYSPSPGVSQVDYRGERHVAGRDPSWMPSLVPHQYSNPFPNASRSQGLHGELPVILGLMALSQGPGFYPPTQWQRRHWRGDPQINQGRLVCILPWERAGNIMPHENRFLHQLAEFSPGPNELPRGVVVQVCYDPENGEGATQEDISKFEWNSIAVKG